MVFWRSTPGVLLVSVSAALVLALLGGWVQVHRVTHPPRPEEAPIDFEAMQIPIEEVVFLSADALELSGWLLWGEPDRVPIILCHDHGASKSSLLNLMIRLHDSGFTVLAFDFRGHGASDGTHTTLGLAEKRDVLGAVAFLGDQERLRDRKFGIYGVGMGAHAAVLAAADRPAVKVLVLDGLYPDVGYSVARLAYRDWTLGVKYLGFLPRMLFALTTRSSMGGARASDVLPRLLGRNLLLVSPAGDTPLAAEMHRMYERVPEQRDADGNLITLPTTKTGDLYGADLDRYHTRIASFFEDRLN